MKKVTGIIADDEKSLRIHLKNTLATLWPKLTILDEAKNGLEAVELIKKNKPDVAFLDIQMPGLTGIEVARKIAGTCRIVFITAYHQYAVEAFENEAMDYILKPVEKKRLKKTVQRLKKQVNETPEPKASIFKTLERILTALKKNESQDYLQWLTTRNKNEAKLISTDEVIFFKADHKYTVVMTKNGESLIRKSINSLAEELDPNRFWRIHRGTIVKVDQINRVSRSSTGRFIIKLKDFSSPLTVSRSYIHLFKQM